MKLETAQIREQLAQLPPHAEQNAEQRKLYQRLSTQLSRRKNADPEKVAEKWKNTEAKQAQKQRLEADKAEENRKYEQAESRWFLTYQLSGESEKENGPNDLELNQLLVQEIEMFLADLHIPSRIFERDYTLLNVDPIGRLILSFLGLPLLDITNCYLDQDGLHPLPAKVTVTEPAQQTFLSDQEEIQRYQQTRAALLLGVEAEETRRKDEHRQHMKELEKQFREGLRKMRSFVVEGKS